MLGAFLQARHGPRRGRLLGVSGGHRAGEDADARRAEDHRVVNPELRHVDVFAALRRVRLAEVAAHGGGGDVQAAPAALALDVVQVLAVRLPEVVGGQLHALHGHVGGRVEEALEGHRPRGEGIAV